MNMMAWSKETVKAELQIEVGNSKWLVTNANGGGRTGGWTRDLPENRPRTLKSTYSTRPYRPTKRVIPYAQHLRIVHDII